MNPAPATTSACTACHLTPSALAHAVSQTDPKFGESCDVCHGAGAAFRRNEDARRSIIIKDRTPCSGCPYHNHGRQVPACVPPGRALAGLVARGHAVTATLGSAQDKAGAPTSAAAGNKTGGHTSAPNLPGRATKTSSTPFRRILTTWWKPTRSAAAKPRPANPATARAASTPSRCPRPTSAIRPNCNPAETDHICLTCHLNQPTHVGRINSSHAKNQVACVACHSIHKNGPDGLVARKTADINNLCAGCHTDVWASFQRPYKHRLPEGAMSCVDCHNPHGSVPAAIDADGESQRTGLPQVPRR